jgi:PST family polysaccharide transporter
MVFVGPSGMALVGNLRNFMTSLEYCHLGFQNGIVKYVAEIKEDKCRLKNYCLRFISLAFVAVVLSVVLFVLLHFGTKKYSNELSIPICFQGVSLSLTLVRHLHL